MAGSAEAREERTPARRRSARERARLIGVGVLLVAAVSGVAGASGQLRPIVTPIPLQQPYKLMSGVTLFSHETAYRVAIGGTTPIPSDATTVALTVRATSSVPGDLVIYPAGNVSDFFAQRTVALRGPKIAVTASFQLVVGTNDQLAFFNRSSGQASVTATVTGYSMAVTAGDIAGADGQPGQVLTNGGIGGSHWQWPAPRAFVAINRDQPSFGREDTTVVSLTVPPGNFLVTGTVQGWGFGETIPGKCTLYSPGGQVIDFRDLRLAPGQPLADMSMQGLLVTAGGQIRLNCQNFSSEFSSAEVINPSIVATEAGPVSGDVVNDNLIGH